jgi:hypothetical protein
MRAVKIVVFGVVAFAILVGANPSSAASRSVTRALEKLKKAEGSSAPQGACDIYQNGRFLVCMQFTEASCQRAGQVLRNAKTKWYAGRECNKVGPIEH